MRVGIITMPLGLNYGGILQAYALQKVLKDQNIDAIHIFKNNVPKKLSFSEKAYIYPKRFIKNLLGKRTPISLEQTMSKLIPVVTQNTRQFIENNISYKEYNSYNDIKEHDFDAIIVGSDQIWRPKYLSDRIEDKFLEFTDSWNIRRVAYAASFGTDIWEYSKSQEKDCRELVQKFDAISVREDSGVQLCRKYLNVDSELVLDPTMLLESEEYISLMNRSGVSKSEGNLYYYILDETGEKMKIVSEIANNFTLTPFKVNAKHIGDFKISDNEKIFPPVEKWLKGFYDADFVVTDSFHGCVFSILFNKQFIVLGNERRGQARFSSLLNMFDLDNRMVTDINYSHSIGDIDYDPVNQKLRYWREISTKFIKKSLSIES